MPEIKQISGRINVFHPEIHFSIGEIVLFVDHTFFFRIDVHENSILTTYYIPKNTTAIIHSVYVRKEAEPFYRVIPTLFHHSDVFGDRYLPRRLAQTYSAGIEKLKYVDLEYRGQKWFTKTMMTLGPDVDHNMLRSVSR